MSLSLFEELRARGLSELLGYEVVIALSDDGFPSGMAAVPGYYRELEFVGSFTGIWLDPDTKEHIPVDVQFGKPEACGGTFNIGKFMQAWDEAEVPQYAEMYLALGCAYAWRGHKEPAKDMWRDNALKAKARTNDIEVKGMIQRNIDLVDPALPVMSLTLDANLRRMILENIKDICAGEVPGVREISESAMSLFQAE